MKRQLLALALLFALVGGLIYHKSVQDAKPFESRSGGFRVWFPSPPKEDQKDSPLGKTTMYHVRTGHVMQSVTWATFDEPDRKAVETYLDSVADTFAGLPHHKAVKSRGAVVLGESPGREMHLDTFGGEMWMRWYVANGRFYQIMFTGPSDEIGPGEVERFFSSFVLIHSE